MKTVLKKKVGFFRYLDLNFCYFLLWHNLWWHGWALTSLDWHLSLQMTWTAGINWHRIELYLCRMGLKFIVSCSQEQRLSLILIFVKFWWLRAKIQGGWSNFQGIVGNQTHFVFESLRNRRDSFCHACLVLSWTQS